MVKGYGFSVGINEILVLVVAAVGLIIVLPYILKMLVSSAAEAVTGAVGDVSKAVDEQIINQDNAITNAAPLQKITFTEFKDDLGYIPEMIVSAGEVIAPQELLIRATEQGAQFGAELAASTPYETMYSTDLERLNADPLKPLIVTGEALSTTFLGFSPYLAGQGVRAWWESL